LINDDIARLEAERIWLNGLKNTHDNKEVETIRVFLTERPLLQEINVKASVLVSPRTVQALCGNRWINDVAMILMLHLIKIEIGRNCGAYIVPLYTGKTPRSIPKRQYPLVFTANVQSCHWVGAVLMGETLHFYDGLKMIQSLDQEPGFQSFIKACCEKAGRVVHKQIYHHLPKQTDHVSCGMHWILFCRDLLTNSASNWTSLDASRSRVDYLLKIIELANEAENKKQKFN